MKPGSVLDPMNQADPRRWTWTTGGIAAAFVLAASGLSLCAGPITARKPAPPFRAAPVPPGRAGVAPRAPKAAATDRFLIVAPTDVDPAMVVRAREDLDPEMVFNRDATHQVATPSGPPPGYFMPDQVSDSVPPR